MLLHDLRWQHHVVPAQGKPMLTGVEPDS